MIGYDKDSIVEYVPFYGGNNLLPLKERMIVDISPLLNKEHLILGQEKNAQDFDDTEEISTFDQKQTRDILKKHVKRIRNYFVRGKEVTDIMELYEIADPHLIQEIINAIQRHSQLTRGQLKNSEGGSDSAMPSEKDSPSNAVPAQSETKS